MQPHPQAAAKSFAVSFAVLGLLCWSAAVLASDAPSLSESDVDQRVRQIQELLSSESHYPFSPAMFAAADIVRKTDDPRLLVRLLSEDNVDSWIAGVHLANTQPILQPEVESLLLNQLEKHHEVAWLAIVPLYRIGSQKGREAAIQKFVDLCNGDHEQVASAMTAMEFINADVRTDLFEAAAGKVPIPAAATAFRMALLNDAKLFTLLTSPRFEVRLFVCELYLERHVEHLQAGRRKFSDVTLFLSVLESVANDANATADQRIAARQWIGDVHLAMNKSQVASPTLGSK